MKRLVKCVVAAGALTVLLALPSGLKRDALGVPGSRRARAGGVRIAADRALNGISRANERAGATFSRKFGEECHVETG